jgi:hypothetical protein
MVIYKVFYKNYEFKKGELMGVFVERRKDLRGKSRLESGLRWAKLMFGQMVRDKHAIFVVPQDFNLKKDSIVPAENMILSKEEFWERGKSSHYDFFIINPLQ